MHTPNKQSQKKTNTELINEINTIKKENQILKESYNNLKSIVQHDAFSPFNLEQNNIPYPTEHKKKSNRNELIFKSDLEGLLIEANQNFCQLFGINHKELQDINLFSSVFPNTIIKIKNTLESLILPPHKCEINLQQMTKLGLRWIHWNLVAGISDEGTIEHVHARGQDITYEIENTEKERNNIFPSSINKLEEACIHVDKNGVITYANPTVLKIYRFSSKNEIIGKNAIILYANPQERETVLKFLKKDGKINDWIGLGIRKDKSIFWMSLNAERIKNKHGDIETKAFFKDITEIKTSEIDEHKQQIQLKTAMEIAELGYYITSGENANIDYVNKKAMNILGFRETNFNRKLSNFWLAHINENDKKNATSIHNDIYNRTKEKTSLEYRYHHPIKGEIWIKHVAILLEEKHRNSKKILGVIEDITIQKIREQEILNAKKELERSELLLNEIQKISHIGGWDYLIKEKKMFWTKELYNIHDLKVNTKIDSLDKSLECFYKKDRNKILNAFQRCVREGIGYDFTFPFKSHKGKKKWIRTTTQPFMNNGEVIKVVGAVIDVSQQIKKERELIKAKEKAEESDLLKSTFLMNISHEIRTPLNAVIGFSSLLEEPDISHDTRKNYNSTIKLSGERLIDTINKIIEISKIEIGDISLRIQQVDLSNLIQFHHDVFKIEAQRKNIKFKISNQISGTSAIIETDKAKLDSIIQNLISNAIKFTEDGFIEIGNYIEEDKVYFYIKDSGIGIPSDKLDLIFNQFMQVKTGPTRKYEGIGIGLSIVNAYVNALNGKITVESKLGEGSTFRFCIPYNKVKNEDPK